MISHIVAQPQPILCVAFPWALQSNGGAMSHQHTIDGCLAVLQDGLSLIVLFISSSKRGGKVYTFLSIISLNLKKRGKDYKLAEPKKQRSLRVLHLYFMAHLGIGSIK